MKSCRRKYKLNTQIHLTKSEPRFKKKIKKKNKRKTITLRWFYGFPLEQIRPGVMKIAERYDLAKNQIDRVLSRIFIHSHCKVRSHNPKRGCASREKIKRIPDFDHTYWVQGLNITTSQNSMTITENGNWLNRLYWYRAIVRCTHLVARILQHGCKFSCWLNVNKISNQTVHHQSATKLDSTLPDTKKKL